MLEGYTFTCATCTRLHVAKAKGLEGCMAAHLKKECCGPFGGSFYPEYEGPLKGRLSDFCFVCGIPSDGAVGVTRGGDLHLVGVCEGHMARLDDVTPQGKSPPRFITHEDIPLVKP